MKKVVLILLVLFMIFPLISAEIIFNQQPKEIHNLGDSVPISLTVKTLKQTSGFFGMNLICNDQEAIFYKNPMSMNAGEEKKIETILILEKEFIGDLIGDCVIKASLGQEYKLSNSFKVSNLININASLNKTLFSPEEKILIFGQAVKENGKNSNGFIEISLIYGNESKANKVATVNNGVFKTELDVSSGMKAGNYALKIYVYEKDSLGEVTNEGTFFQNIKLIQVPKNLEIIFENQDVEPGKNLKVKPILHDQTGEPISSVVFLTIKNSKNKIVEQREIPTDSLFEFPIKYNEAPSSWTIVAVSNKITAEAHFKIIEKESAEIKIINQTLTITNTGNIPYKKTVLVKIGNESLNIDVNLGVDESKKYVLTAPDGNYKVEVLTGSVIKSQDVFLTGKITEIKEAPAKVLSLVSHPAIWIFVILIFCFVIFILIKRNYKKSFIGYHPSLTSSISPSRTKKSVSDGMKNVNEKKINAKDLLNISLPTKESFLDSKTKAEVVVSIKGERQEVSVTTIYIKNFEEIKKDSGVKETLKKIIGVAEDKKAITYESINSITFIFSPLKTRTFKNEKIVLDVAQKIKEILLYHNKMFKQKINFGISLNKGSVIAKLEKGIFKFADVSSLMVGSRKIASLVENDILISEKMNESLKEFVKTSRYEKIGASGIKYYQIREMKNSEQHEKFIRSFLSRNKDNFELK